MRSLRPTLMSIPSWKNLHLWSKSRPPTPFQTHLWIDFASRTEAKHGVRGTKHTSMMQFCTLWIIPALTPDTIFDFKAHLQQIKTATSCSRSLSSLRRSKTLATLVTKTKPYKPKQHPANTAPNDPTRIPSTILTATKTEPKTIPTQHCTTQRSNRGSKHLPYQKSEPLKPSLLGSRACILERNYPQLKLFFSMPSGSHLSSFGAVWVVAPHPPVQSWIWRISWGNSEAHWRDLQQPFPVPSTHRFEFEIRLFPKIVDNAHSHSLQGRQSQLQIVSDGSWWVMWQMGSGTTQWIRMNSCNFLPNSGSLRKSEPKSFGMQWSGVGSW